jgi:hypothetical protein|tara:strand:+ start:3372 stop:4448 length:1077 start_codon:yes stop_codon:yes gene_type:complete
MDIKVREVTGEEKSAAEMEQEVLDKAEQNSVVDDTIQEAEESKEEVVPELKEEDVLSYIKNRYDKDISSFDELMQEKKEAPELPEDVATYMKFKQETGRSFSDFLRTQEEFDEKTEDERLKEYLLATEKGIDRDDLEVIMEEYSYDEDLDDDDDIRKVKLKKKKAVAQAKDWFNQNKEQYKVKLESSSSVVPEADKEQYEAYQQYMKEAKTFEEENQKKREYFVKKTDEVFNSDFKGFDFTVGDKNFTFSTGSATETKEAHLDSMSFVGKYLDEQGLIKDSVGYHRALAVALNPEKFAKFFYEQGQANAVDDTMRKMKNVDMSEARKAPESSRSKDGLTIRAVPSDSGRGLKIRSKKS